MVERTSDIREMQMIQASWISGVLKTRLVGKTVVKLVGEAAELLEAVSYLDKPAKAKELADILILCLDVAELEEIDIVKAFHDKMDENKARTWVIGDGCISHKE